MERMERARERERERQEDYFWFAFHVALILFEERDSCDQVTFSLCPD